MGSVEVLITAIDDVSKKTQAVRKSFVELSKSTQLTTKQTQAVQGATGNLQTQMTGLTTTVGGMGKAIQKTQAPMEQQSTMFQKLFLGTAKMEEGTGDMTMQFRGFRMEMLSVMFFGMALNRMLGFLNKQIMEIYFSAELTNIQFTMIAAMEPMFEPIVETFYDLADVFYELPEAVQGAAGMFFFFSSQMGAAMMLVGQFTLGIGGLYTALKAFGLAIPWWLGAFVALGKAIAVLGIAVGVAFLVRWLADNFEKLPKPIRGITAAMFGMSMLLAKLGDNLGRVKDVAIDFFTAVPRVAFKGVSRIIDAIKRTNLSFLGFRNIIVSSIPTIVGKFIEMTFLIPRALKGLINKLRESGRGMVYAIVDGIRSVGHMVADALLKLIPGPLRWIYETIGGTLKGIIGLQKGGYITAPTVAMLHPGETVLPAGRTETIYFSPTINVYGGGMDERALIGRLEDVIRTEVRRMIT